MFSLPQIVVAPILTSLGSGSATWPTVGAVLAWFLVTALVGSILGILRESTWTSSSREQADGGTVVALPRRAAAAHPHREAA